MNNNEEESCDKNESLFIQELASLTKYRINYLSNIIKNNIAIIVLIPTALGGLIQLLMLGMMDLRYIRYFSVTQLVPDGLLAILILSIVSIIVYLNINVLLSTIPPVSKKFNKSLSNRKFFVHLFIAIGMTITVILAFIKINTTITYLIFTEQDIFQCIAILALTYFNIKFIVFNIHLIENGNFLKISSKTKKYIFKILFIFLGSVMLLGLVLTIMRTTYSLIEYINEPKGLYNYSKIENSIENDFKKYSNYEILYFNDKYTFVKIYLENDSFTVIYKTDSVFFNPTTIDIQ